jgi:hypothetical protein
MLQFGVEAYDVITGFTGAIIAYVQYMTGCNQYLLAPRVDKEGKQIESHWFDEARIKVKDKGATVTLDSEPDKNGPDKPAPKI